MFRVTRPLQRKTELRLRGFRGPSVRILRQELRRLIPIARTTYSSNIDSKCRKKDILHAEVTVDRTYKALFNGNRRLGNIPGLVTKPNWSWAHSIYCFNDNTIKGLFASVEVSKTAIRAHLNSLPCGSSQLLSTNDGQKHISRAFMSDLHRKQFLLPQAFSSKVSRYRSAFWRPFRKMLTWDAPILFKHYSSGRIDALLFAHDTRIQFLEHKLASLRNQIEKVLIRFPYSETSFTRKSR
jgi:hypothetical protein